jgi:hypothetical protein
MQKIADAKDYKIPATIDPSILGEIDNALSGIGYSHNRK